MFKKLTPNIIANKRHMKNIQRNATIMLIFVFFLSGCASYGRYFVESCTNPLEAKEFIQPDGYRSLYYNFKIGIIENPDTVLFFIGGSGCHSHKYYARQYLDGLSGNIAIFALQKRGVNDRTTGIFGCSQEFQKLDYFEQWLSDQRAFIAHILSTIPAAPKRVVIVGVSEGALTAAAITAENNSINHLVIIGAGGMKQIDELRLLASKGQFPSDIDMKFKEIIADPDNTKKMLYGHSFKYWSSIMDVDPMQYFEKIEVPILVGFGEADTSVPVETVYRLKDRMAILGKENMNLIICPDADHALKVKGQDYRKVFFQEVSKWLQL